LQFNLVGKTTVDRYELMISRPETASAPSYYPELMAIESPCPPAEYF